MEIKPNQTQSERELTLQNRTVALKNYINKVAQNHNDAVEFLMEKINRAEGLAIAHLAYSLLLTAYLIWGR